MLTLTVAKDGKIDGTLLDRSGMHAIVNPSVKGSTLTFTVVYHTPGIAGVPFSYTVSLDPDDVKVAIDRPDFTPAAKVAGKLRHHEEPASHTN